MISYNWGHQKEALSIKNVLKEKGFPVWLDVDNGIKEGDVNEAMADGVDAQCLKAIRTLTTRSKAPV